MVPTVTSVEDLVPGTLYRTVGAMMFLILSVQKEGDVVYVTWLDNKGLSTVKYSRHWPVSLRPVTGDSR